MIGGIVALCIVCGKKRRRPARSGSARTVATRTTKTVYTLGTKNSNAQQAERNAEKERKAQFARVQARDDIVHYEQQQRDIMRLYDYAETEYNQSATDRKKAAAYSRMIALDNRMRTLQKQKEKAAYIANRA